MSDIPLMDPKLHDRNYRAEMFQHIMIAMRQEAKDKDGLKLWLDMGPLMKAYGDLEKQMYPDMELVPIPEWL